MKKNIRKQYDEAFKAEVINYVKNHPNIKISRIAEHFLVSSQSINNWMARDKLNRKVDELTNPLVKGKVFREIHEEEKKEMTFRELIDVTLEDLKKLNEFLEKWLK